MFHSGSLCLKLGLARSVMESLWSLITRLFDMDRRLCILGMSLWDRNHLLPKNNSLLYLLNTSRLKRRNYPVVEDSNSVRCAPLY